MSLSLLCMQHLQRLLYHICEMMVVLDQTEKCGEEFLGESPLVVSASRLALFICVFSYIDILLVGTSNDQYGDLWRILRGIGWHYQSQCVQ